MSYDLDEFYGDVPDFSVDIFDEEESAEKSRVRSTLTRRQSSHIQSPVSELPGREMRQHQLHYINNPQHLSTSGCGTYLWVFLILIFGLAVVVVVSLNWHGPGFFGFPYNHYTTASPSVHKSSIHTDPRFIEKQLELMQEWGQYKKDLMKLKSSVSHFRFELPKEQPKDGVVGIRVDSLSDLPSIISFRVCCLHKERNSMVCDDASHKHLVEEDEKTYGTAHRFHCELREAGLLIAGANDFLNSACTLTWWTE